MRGPSGQEPVLPGIIHSALDAPAAGVDGREVHLLACRDVDDVGGLKGVEIAMKVAGRRRRAPVTHRRRHR
jgi:hypothetical protein